MNFPTPGIIINIRTCDVEVESPSFCPLGFPEADLNSLRIRRLRSDGPQSSNDISQPHKFWWIIVKHIYRLKRQMMMSTFIHLKIQTVELPSSVRYYAGTDLLIYLGQFAQKGPIRWRIHILKNGYFLFFFSSFWTFPAYSINCPRNTFSLASSHGSPSNDSHWI